ncbi:MAG: hypothetical protein ACTS77_01625 [Arsenophonus sp. NC-TX2-MAG3]
MRNQSSIKYATINSYSTGNYVNRNGDNCIAIGLSSNSWGDGSIALGRNAIACERSSVVLGTDFYYQINNMIKKY